MGLTTAIGLVLGVALAVSSCTTSSTLSSPDRSHSTSPTGTVTVPTSTGYAQTCRLIRSWCEPTTGSVPEALSRALALPSVEPGEPCPTTVGSAVSTAAFGGIALGEGSVRPLIAQEDRVGAQDGQLDLVSSKHGWLLVKTLWFAARGYHGAVLIRGRQLDGSNPVAFGVAPVLGDVQLPPGQTINHVGGYRTWPGATWLRAPGCYAWQVDTADASEIIVFQAS